MSQGVRRTTAGKGIDPKDLVMLAYGGNGPAFAAIQAEDLGIHRVLVPKASPTFSALGTLVADPSIDEERSYFAKATELDLGRVKALWDELATRAEKFFVAANFKREEVRAQYQLNMRYPGQNFSLTFDVPSTGRLHDFGFVDEGLGAKAIELFNARHMAEYNHIREHEVPEIAGVRLATRVADPVALGHRRLHRAGDPRDPGQDPPRQPRRGLRRDPGVQGRRPRPRHRDPGARDHRGDLHHDRRLPRLESAGRRCGRLRAGTELRRPQAIRTPVGTRECFAHRTMNITKILEGIAQT